MPVYTILIVDDEEILANMLSHQLGKLGYKTFIARDGLEATNEASKHKPDLILLDYQMPAADGATVHQRLQHSMDTHSTPVIFISGAAVQDLLPAQPHTRFLQKPLNMKKLIETIHELLHDGVPSPKTKTVLDLEETDPPDQEDAGK